MWQIMRRNERARSIFFVSFGWIETKVTYNISGWHFTANHLQLNCKQMRVLISRAVASPPTANTSARPMAIFMLLSIDWIWFWFHAVRSRGACASLRPLSASKWRLNSTRLFIFKLNFFHKFRPPDFELTVSFFSAQFLSLSLSVAFAGPVACQCVY